MKKSNTCKNCNSENINNFCSNCGQKVYNKRFTIKSFIKSLLTAFDVEMGFLFTVKMLFRKPGKVTNDYLNGKTKPYYNPLKYLLIIGGIYAFLLLWLKIFDAGLEAMGGMPASQNNSEEVVRLQNQWLNFYKQIINFIPLLMIPFISLASKWFYKTKGLFYGEHLIINSYLFIQSIVIIIFLTPLTIIFQSLKSYFPVFTVLAMVIYLSYSYHSTFGESRLKSTLGAFFSLIIGYLLFILFLIFIIFIIGVIITISK